MNDESYLPPDVEPPTPPPAMPDWRRLVSLSPLILVSVITVGAWSSAPQFARLFDLMLGGEPLPVLTEFSLHYWWLCMPILAISAASAMVLWWRTQSWETRLYVDLTVLFQLICAFLFAAAMILPQFKLIDTIGG